MSLKAVIAALPLLFPALAAGSLHPESDYQALWCEAAGGEVEFSADGTVSGLSLEWERKARAYAREHKCSYEEAAAATAG